MELIISLAINKELLGLIMLNKCDAALYKGNVN